MKPGRLERIAHRALDAAAEALFPPNTLGAPDHREADVAGRMRAYLDEVPASHRRLVVLLFVFVEWSPPWVALYPRRFSKLSIASRQRLIRRWRASPIYPLRMIGEALKGLGTMIYCSHPAVLKYMGVYTTSPRDWDPLSIEGRPGALVQLGSGRPSQVPTAAPPTPAAAPDTPAAAPDAAAAAPDAAPPPTATPDAEVPTS